MSNVVYKITNNINNKVYIGSSVRVEKRWQQHKNDAFNPNNKKFTAWVFEVDETFYEDFNRLQGKEQQ